MKEFLRYWLEEIAYWISQVILPIAVIRFVMAFEGWLISLALKL